jgi:hypothetical protein
MSPISYDPISPPGRFDALQELRLPGFGTGSRAMRVMESFLTRQGHRVRDWGLGRNNGETRR